MASVAEGSSQAEVGLNATQASAYTVTEILKMTVGQLKTAIQSFKVEPTGKRDSQVQLIEIVKVSSGQDELHEDDDEELTISLASAWSQSRR
jgi:hypothetical protein